MHQVDHQTCWEPVETILQRIQTPASGQIMYMLDSLHNGAKTSTSHSFPGSPASKHILIVKVQG